MTNRKLIIFEGIDGSSKSTLEDAYRKANNYMDYTIHRFTGSKYVYDNYYKRQFSFEELAKDENNLSQKFNVRLIWCCLPPLIARNRIKERDFLPFFESGESFEFYQSTNDLFHQYWTITRFKAKLRIDTSKSLKKCLSELQYFVSLPFEEACCYDS